MSFNKNLFIINMHCSSSVISKYIFILLVVMSLLYNGVTARTPIRDYIATDHVQAASSVDTSVLQDKPKKNLSRKEMFEILHSGQYFQDIFMEHLAPFKLQFGHVCENPNEWQQRFEKNDFDNNRYQGKVRWGNANGGYGEHYWDLGHAG